MTILEYYDIMCRKTDFTFRGWLKMDRTKWKVLDRGKIKYIAMFTMLLNHISTIFMESGNFLSELFRVIFLLKGINIPIQRKNMVID